MTDIELVRSVIAGDGESFRTLMERYRDPAMALALNMLTNFQDAEDACQDGFLKAYKNIRRFDVGRSFKTWVCAVVANSCLDQLRKKRGFFRVVGRLKRDQLAEAAGRPAPPPAPEALDFARLKSLSPKERACLYLWSQDGCSGEEIAAALGCSRQTAYVHLFRARAKLRKAIDEGKHAAS